MPSEVKMLKTKAAAKLGPGAIPGGTETIWPKPEFVGLSFLALSQFLYVLPSEHLC